MGKSGRIKKQKQNKENQLYEPIISNTCKNCIDSKYNSNIAKGNFVILKIFTLLLAFFPLFFNGTLDNGTSFPVAIIAFNCPIFIDSYVRVFGKKIYNDMNRFVVISTLISLFVAFLSFVQFFYFSNGKMYFGKDIFLHGYFKNGISNKWFVVIFTIIFIIEITLHLSSSEESVKCPHKKK